jgi:hypothetical protein
VWQILLLSLGVLRKIFYMKKKREHVMSFKVTQDVRTMVEQLAAHLAVKRGRRHTMTDVIEEGVTVLARLHGYRKPRKNPTPK